MDSALRVTDGLNNLGAAGMTVTAQNDSENAREEEVEEEVDGQDSSLPRKPSSIKYQYEKEHTNKISESHLSELGIKEQR